MKKTDFDKKIKIIDADEKKVLMLNYTSILYTTNQYIIPVLFADNGNSIDDTKRYIKENYTKEQQEKLKHNDKINSELLATLVKETPKTEEDIQQLVKKYSKEYLKVNYSAPTELRTLTLNDDIETMTGYFVIDANAFIGDTGDLLCEFLNLDMNTFNQYLIFFTKYLGMFIKNFSNKDLEDIQIDKLTDMNTVISLAKKIYTTTKDEIIQKQKLFKKFVDYLFNNNDSEVSSLSLKQRFYVFSEANKDELNTFANSYSYNGMFNFYYANKDLKKLKHKNISELIAKIKIFDPNGSNIHSSYSIITENIYTVFYISLYNLVLSNTNIIRECKNCHRHFLTNKTNTYYCDNIYNKEQNKTCKDIGNQLSQKRKENDEPAYGKYRSLYAKKATLLKRNPDIYSREDYDKWKQEAKQFMNDIRNGIKTYEEFDKWLDRK